MKKNSWFFLLIIFLLTGLSFCSKEEPIPISGDQVLGLPFFLTTDDVNSITCGSARSGGYIIDNVGGCGVLTAKGVCWSTAPNPTTADNKAIDNTYLDDPKHFHATIYGLNSATTYYVRAFATNSAGTVYGNKVSFTTPECTDPTSDIDGNIYKTVQIGTQTWMAENLKTTKYNDGSQIPNVTGDNDWAGLTTGAYRWYNNDVATFKNLYGALYNWYTVNAGKLCPTGWHVPSDDEWKQLEMALGMTQAEADSWGGEDYGDIGRGTDQGTQMKTTSGWIDWWEGINGNGTNTSGFSGLPGGDTGWYGKCEIAGQCGSWWSSTIGVARVLGSDEGRVGRAHYYLHIGFSVRCLKD
jgi:uncharacterized protein (TIGR02145 family)